MRLRMQITKEAGIRFVSHLEYQRTIERALRRAKLPVAYSEGFNPHMKFSLASALGVGITSDCEFVEIQLTQEVALQETLSRLQQALPLGIHIVKGDLVENTAPKLMASAAGAEYLVKVPCASNGKEQLAAFNAADSFVYHKPMHKGRIKVKDIEVKDLIPKIQGKWQDGSLEIRFTCRITSQGSMKATELLQLLQQEFHLPIKVEQADIRRINLFALNKEGHKRALLS